MNHNQNYRKNNVGIVRGAERFAASWTSAADRLLAVGFIRPGAMAQAASDNRLSPDDMPTPEQGAVCEFLTAYGVMYPDEYWPPVATEKAVAYIAGFYGLRGDAVSSIAYAEGSGVGAEHFARQVREHSQRASIYHDLSDRILGDTRPIAEILDHLRHNVTGGAKLSALRPPAPKLVIPRDVRRSIKRRAAI